MLNRIRSLVAVFSLFTLLGTLAPLPIARAATASMSEAEAVSLLQTYSIVKGDERGNLNLDKPLTRAEAATIFIRSYGGEDLAKALATIVPFPDAKGHWGAGAIAFAERMGLMKGDPSGNFRPDAEITYAEVLTVLLRMVEKEPAGAWSVNSIMSAANQLGIAPTNVDGSQRAIRGKIFWSLATTTTQIPLPSGQTVLQKHVDSVPPQLTLDQTQITTSDRSVTIAGTARDASQVTVDGKAATLTKSTGKFTFTANVDVGTTEFTVDASDLLGNKATATVRVTRRANISRIDITGPAAVKVGSSTKLTVKALDAQGNEVSLDGIQAEVSSTVATFDMATQTLRASNNVGRATLTLKSGNVTKSFTFDVTSESARGDALVIASVNDGRAPTVGKAATIKVHVVDENGKLVTDDYFRTVTLTSSGLTGVSISQQSVTTQGGVATFTVTGSREGAATFTAKSTDLVSADEVVEFLGSTRIVLTATPNSLRPDGTQTTSIRATLQDENGKAIANNSDSNIVIALAVSGSDGQLTDTELTIRKGASTSSGDDGTFRAGVRAGTATITGTITSSQKYSVQTLTVPVNNALAGVKLQVTGPTTRQTPGGAPATLTVRVLDSSNRVVTAGSYTFQLTVTTSNNDKTVEGLPEDVDLFFANSSYKPVDDGRSANDPLDNPYAVVGRTYQGQATVTLGYAKSGVITVTPKLVAASDDAYHPTSGFGSASASTGLTPMPYEITFAGAAASIKLTADSSLGKNQPGGAVATAATMTVRAQVVDANGAPVPGYNSDITLTRGNSGNLVTNITGANKKKAVDGVAEFTVQAVNTAGFDTYSATSGTLGSNQLTLAVRKEKELAPDINAIRGVKEGDPSPVLKFVGPDADYMDIQLYSHVPPNSGEPHYWVTAKVYRKGESSPFFTSGAIDLKSDLPVIRIPRSSLKTGKAVYEVSINNGAGDSPRSIDLGMSEAIVASYNTSYRLNSAQYDAETGRLLISASSLASNGILDTTRLYLVKGNNRLNLGDPDVAVHSLSSSSIDLRLNSLKDHVDTAIYNGTVTLEAEDGWFTSADGSQAAKASNTAQVKPMAIITHATLEEGNKRLYLHGFGFSQGTLSANLIEFHGSGGGDPVALKPGTSTSTDRVTNTTDNQITITLSQATLDALNALTGPEIYVTADIGWLKTGSGSSTFKVGAVAGPDHRLYVRATINKAEFDRKTNTLTISGAGLTDAILSPAKLEFRARGTTATWTASSATTPVTALNDTTIQLVLAQADADAFLTRFSGRSVIMNTKDGWLIDSKDRAALPLPNDSILFSVLAK